MNRHRVTIWRLEVLPGSETFIRNQGDALELWQPTLLGSVAVPSVLRRPDDRIVFDRSLADRVRLAVAAATGRSRKVRRALASTRPDLVHAHFGKDALMIAPAARRLGVPLVVTLHGYDVTALAAGDDQAARRYRRRLRALLGRADAVIAVSRFIADRALALGADPDRTVVLPIGVPLTPEPDPADGEIVWDVIFVGRFVQKKGILDALAAVAAQPAGRELNCLFIGEGPVRDAAGRLAEDLGLRVTFPGALGPMEVRRELARSRVFVGPSRTAADGDAEGFGMVFLEAAAAGIPVIGYRHGGVPEAVQDGVTGLLVAEGDVAGLAAALHRLLTDRELAQRWGRAGRERVAHHFEMTMCTAPLEKLYDRLIGPPRR